MLYFSSLFLNKYPTPQLNEGFTGKESLTKSSVVVVQSLSPVGLFVTPWAATDQAPLSSAVSQRLLKVHVF